MFTSLAVGGIIGMYILALGLSWIIYEIGA